MTSWGVPLLMVACVSLPTSACASSEPAQPPANPAEKIFLDILSGPIREDYDSKVLIAEGHKACDAFSRGQNVDQVMTMVQQDLKADPGIAGQFIGAVTGGLSCYPQ